MLLTTGQPFGSREERIAVTGEPASASDAEDTSADRRPRLAVFAPSPLLTITIEAVAGGDEDVHLHAGGQGFWIARMAASLGAHVCLSGTFGGEPGRVTAALIEQEGVRVRRVETAGGNGVHVQDRRTGERVTVATMRPVPLARHELDAVYGVTLVEGMEADVCVLGGHVDPEVVPADTYERLAADLRTNQATVVADLSGQALDAVLRGGVTLLKVSAEDLVANGSAAADSPDQLVPVVERLAAQGAANVVVSRAAQPALALLDGELFDVIAPTLHPLDDRGAGDSMTAGLAVGMAGHGDLFAASRLGAAAGALNVTRRGLGTGEREEIERLAAHVVVRPFQRSG